jgi:hypothetical protein
MVRTMDRNKIADAVKLAVNWPPADVPAALRARFPYATPGELKFVEIVVALTIAIEEINRGELKELK